MTFPMNYSFRRRAVMDALQLRSGGNIRPNPYGQNELKCVMRSENVYMGRISLSNSLEELMGDLTQSKYVFS